MAGLLSLRLRGRAPTGYPDLNSRATAGCAHSCGHGLPRAIGAEPRTERRGRVVEAFLAALAGSYEAAGIRRNQTGDQTQRGGFTDGAWSEQNKEAPFSDFEIQIRKSTHRPIGL